MSSAHPARNPPPRGDIRRRALIITVLAITVFGFAVSLRPSLQPPGTDGLSFSDMLKVRPHTTAASAAQTAEVRTRFEQGVTMLQLQQYDRALIAFHEVLKLAPKLPEAHVNMGFALIGLNRWRDARNFFETAIELRRDQMNAYYGLAIALEGQGDLPGAVGAMQAYLHRANQDDPFREGAQAALAKWRGSLPPNQDRAVPTPSAAKSTH